MSEYWIDKDSNGDETLWRDDGRIFEPVNAEPVVRRCDLGSPAALLWKIVTGVLTEDDATVERVAKAISGPQAERWEHLPLDLILAYREQARAALRALREVSS